jgi:hypothetical protein
MERVDKVGATHQASAIRAALRTAGSTSPPTQIGGRGLCLGLTLALALSSRKYLPWWVTLSSVHSRLISSRPSVRRPTRSRSATPIAWNSSGR